MVVYIILPPSPYFSPFTLETSGWAGIIHSQFTSETSGCGNIIPFHFTFEKSEYGGIISFHFAFETQGCGSIIPSPSTGEGGVGVIFHPSLCLFQGMGG